MICGSVLSGLEGPRYGAFVGGASSDDFWFRVIGPGRPLLRCFCRRRFQRRFVVRCYRAWKALATVLLSEVLLAAIFGFVLSGLEGPRYGAFVGGASSGDLWFGFIGPGRPSLHGFVGGASSGDLWFGVIGPGRPSLHGFVGGASSGDLWFGVIGPGRPSLRCFCRRCF